MGTKMEIELYKDLRSVCNQAQMELCMAYKYLEKIPDPNGICILLREIHDFDNLFYTLESFDPRPPIPLPHPQIILPNSFEWGIPKGQNLYVAKADTAVINAINQKNVKTSQKLYMKNGSFYGYYCYNVYHKCLGWINHALKKIPLQQHLTN